MENRVEKEKLAAFPEPLERTSNMFQEATVIFKQLNDAGQRVAIAMLKGLASHEKYRMK
ncbi:MAG: hypothetical protein IJS09_04165 [Treponema sp.]|nr:hypothetical protein [Treponema sp.]